MSAWLESYENEKQHVFSDVDFLCSLSTGRQAKHMVGRLIRFIARSVWLNEQKNKRGIDLAV
jgi:hypothetical protein